MAHEEVGQDQRAAKVGRLALSRRLSVDELVAIAATAIGVAWAILEAFT